MSRSYKKTPGYTDGGSARKWFKRCSNKKTRKNWNLDSGGAYKKNGYTYSICDWKSLYFKPSDYVSNRWRTESEEPSVKDIYRAKMK